MIATEEGWVVLVPTRFIRDHVRSQFGLQITRAAELAGLADVRVEMEPAKE